MGTQLKQRHSRDVKFLDKMFFESEIDEAYRNQRKDLKLIDYLKVKNQRPVK